MPIDYPGQRIRCEVDIFERGYRFVDVLTGESPQMWRGGKGQFEIGFFYGHGPGKTLASLSGNGLSAITLALRGPYDGTAAGRLSPIEFSKTLAKAQMSLAMTIDEWNSNAPDKAHAIIKFTDDEVSLDNLGEDTKFWMPISGLSDDNPAQEIPMAASVLTMLEDGVVDGNAPRQKLVIRNDNGKKYLLQATWSNNVNELFADTEVTGNAPYRTVIVKDEVTNTWHEVKCLTLLDGDGNPFQEVYADPAPLADITSYPKNLVRNTVDWEYYELKLRTENAQKELYLAEEPIC